MWWRDFWRDLLFVVACFVVAVVIIPTYNGRHVMHVLLVVLAMVLVVAAVILAVVILRL